jgi:hypothetical protein
MSMNQQVKEMILTVPGWPEMTAEQLRQHLIAEVLTLSEVEEARASLLLQDKRHRKYIREANRWNACANAIAIWDGSPETEPVL